MMNTCVHRPATEQGGFMAAQIAQVRHPGNTGCILSKFNCNLCMCCTVYITFT